MNLSPEQTWLLAQQINSYVVATENIRDDCINYPPHYLWPDRKGTAGRANCGQWLHLPFTVRP